MIQRFADKFCAWCLCVFRYERSQILQYNEELIYPFDRFLGDFFLFFVCRACIAQFILDFRYSPFGAGGLCIQFVFYLLYGLTGFFDFPFNGSRIGFSL